jgi:hypothetical protein
MDNVLNKYHNYKDESKMFPLGETILIDINNNIGEIKYTFPTTIEECIYIDY